MIRKNIVRGFLATLIFGAGCADEEVLHEVLLEQAGPESSMAPMSDGGLIAADGGALDGSARDAGYVDVPWGDDRTNGKSRSDPAGAYFVSVRANGTGCPAGTWATSISPDGKRFRVTFSAFEAVVSKHMSLAIKDCQLGIKLKSPSGFSYAVTDFSFQGYAYLEKGQSARQIARYYFQGAPVQSEEARAELVGPYDDTYVFRDTVRTTDIVWSPCGVERDLNVRMTLRLNNGAEKKDGYINLYEALNFQLAWRRC